MFELLGALTGEESCFRILGDFYSRYHERGAAGAECVDSVRSESEIDPTHFFDEWIFGIESNQYLKDKVSYAEIIKEYIQ